MRKLILLICILCSFTCLAKEKEHFDIIVNQLFGVLNRDTKELIMFSLKLK